MPGFLIAARTVAIFGHCSQGRPWSGQVSWTGPSDGPETGCLVGWVGEGASTLQEEPASWGTGDGTKPGNRLPPVNLCPRPPCSLAVRAATLIPAPPGLNSLQFLPIYIKYPCNCYSVVKDRYTLLPWRRRFLARTPRSHGCRRMWPCHCRPPQPKPRKDVGPRRLGTAHRPDLCRRPRQVRSNRPRLCPSCSACT